MCRTKGYELDAVDMISEVKEQWTFRISSTTTPEPLCLAVLLIVIGVGGKFDPGFVAKLVIAFASHVAVTQQSN